MTVDVAHAPAPTRTAFKAALLAAMARDQRVVCVDTDTGLFKESDFAPFADRYFNAGIAEQTAVSLAAGMARQGLRPVVCMFAAFATNRAIDAVKIDIAYAGLPVCIVGTHAGLSAGFLGPTHHCLEDLAYLRVLPNLTVVVPADADQTVDLTAQVLALDSPAYLRLGRKASPRLPHADAPVLRRPQPLRGGRDVVILACGPEPVASAYQAADLLRDASVDAAVVNMHTLKPIAPDDILDLLPTDCRLVVTIEDHWRSGGLGDAVADVLCSYRPLPMLRLAAADAFYSVAAPHLTLLEQAGLDAPTVTSRVLRALGAHRGIPKLLTPPDRSYRSASIT